MTEPVTELATVHAVITELAAAVAGARAALDGATGGSDDQLEMAEMDLLSAQSSIEKACMMLDVSPSSVGDVRRFLRPALPGRPANVVEHSAVLRRVHRPGRRAPGLGQCELFTLPAALNEQHLWR